MLTIRALQVDDRPFILDSFRRSFEAAAGPNTRPYPVHCFAHLLEIGECRVAVVPDEPDVIIGWALVIGWTLEYVYVKKDARRCGIARELATGCTRAGCTTAQWTHIYAERLGR